MIDTFKDLSPSDLLRVVYDILSREYTVYGATRYTTDRLIREFFSCGSEENYDPDVCVTILLKGLESAIQKAELKILESANQPTERT
jgi:hypothetical protein